jgi:hypothetical protein
MWRFQQYGLDAYFKDHRTHEGTTALPRPAYIVVHGRMAERFAYRGYHRDGKAVDHHFPTGQPHRRT